MRASFRLTAVVLLTAPALLAPTSPAATAAPAPATPGAPADTRGLSHKTYSIAGLATRTPGLARRTAGPTPPTGTVREWLALDDVDARYYRKNYTLRGVGTRIEVWVANDLAFPAGDCRPAASTQVSDAQVADLIREFDQTIYPRETTAFSTPPDRDGADAALTGDFTGDGTRTVTLVDNIRDDNYFTFPENSTYIAGFFSSQLTELLDRNVMTIDAYDWKHRTGATPVDEATDDLCTSRPARPRMYEGTFAHEWQHLLQYYTDPNEDLWVNEGLSDYAQTLAGYVDGTATVYRRGADSHLTCFQGFATVKTAYNPNPRDCGGPQGSLNLWDEGASEEVLSDYGHAYQFLLYLKDRFGPGVLERLHTDRAHQGLAGVEAALGTDLSDVLHDFQTMTLVDKIAEEGSVLGTSRERVVAPSLRSTVNLANPAAYAKPGAAPNGADYVRLRDAKGKSLSGADLRSVRFQGGRTLNPLPLAWTVRDGALFSGDASDTDAMAVIGLQVPAGESALTLRAKYGAEQGFDYGYVTISTDGGQTYHPIIGDRTSPGPLGHGVTGTTDGFAPHRYDLSGFAGRNVLLGFQYVSDGAVNEGGWYLDDIAVNGRQLSDGSSVRGFRSPSEVAPVPVHAWHVRLVGLDEAGKRVRQVTLSQFAELRAYPKVVAIVAYDEPTGRITQYAPYTLTVNGAQQPGGEKPVG